jgi:hypothetical protein
MYSDDGGVTFVDGGQLPSPGLDLIGTTRLPQVLGDPDVRNLGGCNFVYSSILVKKFSATRTVQTMAVHRSTDCGHTWAGPFEVTPVTNPNGLVTGAGVPRDSADKEFIAVDPETGRVLLTWSNFTPVAAGGVEISATYSDNILTATPPTWSTRAIVAAGPSDGQSSQPMFARGSSNAYVVWRQFPFPGTFSGLGNTIGFSRSTDNGATWSAPVALSSEFFTVDQILGNDRINTTPSIAVDNSAPDDAHKGHGGSHAGNIYVVYPNNNSQDGADIVFQKSTNGGLTFTAPVALNSRPGNDRSQWFPWVTVDSSTGRVWVFYYDQGITTSGDRSETTVTWSDDAGAHWSPPVPLTDRPFHAGWGNDTGQPNLGDYNQAVAQNGELFAAFAVASRPLLGFVDGQPSSASLNTPDVVLRRVPESSGDAASPVSREIDTIPVHIVSVTATDSGGSGSNGFIDPGETVKVTFHGTAVDHDAGRDGHPGPVAVLEHEPGRLVVEQEGLRPVDRAELRRRHPDRAGAHRALQRARSGHAAPHPVHRHPRAHHPPLRKLQRGRSGGSPGRLGDLARRRRQHCAVDDQRELRDLPLRHLERCLPPERQRRHPGEHPLRAAVQPGLQRSGQRRLRHRRLRRLLRHRGRSVLQHPGL